MQFSDIITKRQSVKSYDPTFEISDADLKAIFEQVRLSPSAFNLQNWHFIVVRDKARKQEMRKVSWNQPHVEEASAIVVVVGRLDGASRAAEVWAAEPAQIRDMVIAKAQKLYQEHPEIIRDEAIRTTSLAAMILMLAAVDRGFGVCPLVGFDPAAISKIVGLGEKEMPVMMISMGKPKGEIPPRRHRYAVEQFVTCETRNGPGLK